MTIEWAYIRKGCTSCKKALAYFEEHKISVDLTVDARKEKIDAQKAWDVIKHQKHIYIAKGKNKILTFVPEASDAEEILKHALGRTGNLRAPTVIRMANIFIGFNEDIYTRL
ncbi:ArsC family (seleno)protein [uncultured Desulfobacter sp.]|uniref:ArsC family (seleno)protein n=1 Tax=uncultured Desulfobacter sp. TaxID=240139 RepID=UPI0029F4989F|nr:ArsC family (seleno)protein [uncultured Desulfobacter sp.]